MGFEMTAFEWKTKKHRVESVSHRNNQDVQISICKGSEKSKVVAISFKHDMSKLITKTGYIVTSVKKNRLYFAEADARDGFKCAPSTGNNPEIAYTRFTVSEYEINEIYKKFIGFYDLKFDEFNEYYYIELEDK